jgi:hypothetical protein
MSVLATPLTHTHSPHTPLEGVNASRVGGVCAHETEDFTFTFTATGDGPPVEIRVRRMLKSALRHYGLKASWALPAQAALTKPKTPKPAKRENRA